MDWASDAVLTVDAAGAAAAANSDAGQRQAVRRPPRREKHRNCHDLHREDGIDSLMVDDASEAAAARSGSAARLARSAALAIISAGK